MSTSVNRRIILVLMLLFAFTSLSVSPGFCATWKNLGKVGGYKVKWLKPSHCYKVKRMGSGEEPETLCAFSDGHLSFGDQTWQPTSNGWQEYDTGEYVKRGSGLYSLLEFISEHYRRKH